MIDIGKLERRTNLLKSGKMLLLKHQYYGDYIVRMNPQQNRIFREIVRGEDISEEKVNHMLLWDCGDWFIYDEPVKTKCACCNGTGVLQDEPKPVQV